MYYRLQLSQKGRHHLLRLSIQQVVEETTIQVVEEEEIQEVVEESQSFHYAIKEQFIQGGWQFMGIVLECQLEAHLESIRKSKNNTYHK